jgi:hypothetical protein
MATEIITSFGRQVDSNGVPLNGALVYVYDVGTTTPKSVFSDTALTVSAANPIVCDAYGLHDMRYIATGSYKIVVKTSAGSTVYTRDNIDGRVPVGSGALAIANGGTGATSAVAALTALGAATASEVADLAADVASLAGAASSSEKTQIATGTTAQRPATPADGQIRRNTTIPHYEGYDGAASTYRKFLTDGDIATQANMETATSATTLVTPGRVQYHPGVAKAWGIVTYSGGTPTLAANFGISGITDSGTGSLTVTMSTAMSSANYAIVATIALSSGTGGWNVLESSISTTAFRIDVTNFAGTALDPTRIFFAVYGDQ